MSVKDFSTTPASNATVGAINFAELQVPSSLNDSARNLMADIKEWYNEITGGTKSGTVGGTADAITLTTTPTLAAYAVNQRFVVKAGSANTATAPTLNVSGLGAKTIKLPGGTALIASQWVTGDMLQLVYDGTDMILLSGDSARGSPFTASISRNAQTGTTYTVVSGDRGKHLTFSNAATVAVTLPQATGSFGSGWFAWFENVGAGTATVTPSTSTINLGTALVLRTGEWGLITSDGTNYRTFTNARITGASSVREIGTRGLPVVTADLNYQFAFGDEGGIIRHTSVSAHTYTIPANSTAAFPVGTAITIVNEPGAGSITVAITTDTLTEVMELWELEVEQLVSIQSQLL